MVRRVVSGDRSWSVVAVRAGKRAGQVDNGCCPAGLWAAHGWFKEWRLCPLRLGALSRSAHDGAETQIS